MFDTLIVRHELPSALRKPPIGAWWQTQDLECVLETYTLTEDGRLLDPMGQLLAFDGPLEFYTGDQGWWWLYEAQFMSGELQTIALVACTAPVGEQ
jgi:hypothetical protein